MELRKVGGVILGILLVFMVFYTLILVAQIITTTPAINISEDHFTQNIGYYHDPPLGFSYIVMFVVIVIGISCFYCFTAEKDSDETEEKQ